jgi:hypothetical protein
MGKVGTPRAINLSGQTFNQLTAKEIVGYSKSGTAMWRCVCVCGKETKVASSDLRGSRIKACLGHRQSKTVEYMLYQAAKSRARRLQIPFTISCSDIVIPKTCPILGTPIHHHAGTLKEDSPSLERVYPSDGYVSGNVVVISHKANRMKGACSPEELVALGEKFRRLYETLG